MTLTDPKAIQQIEFFEQLNNPNNVLVANESMFFLAILEIIKKLRVKFSQWNITLLQKMANYQDAKVNITNTQLSKTNLPQKVRQEQYQESIRKSLKIQ